MGSCIGWILLGAFFGGVAGFAAGLIPVLLGGTTMDTIRMAQGLGAILGGGFGAVAGAIAGGAQEIANAIRSQQS